MSCEDMNLSVNGKSKVPPGFRFHPTEEELLHYYLRKKVTRQKIDLDVIRDVDLNKLEPWDIQEKCKIGSTPQNDWYLFSHKDKKYPSGTRTNRATTTGFWKATGRDKVIHNNLRRIGMRKTLVFYSGRAPHGKKSDWIMHEYRLDDTNPHESTSVSSFSDDAGPEEGWVVCRVFKKKNYLKTLDNTLPSSASIMSNKNDGVPDQLKMQIGRSSPCKQENDPTMNLHNLSTDYLHLPELECSTMNHPPPSNIADDCSFKSPAGELMPSSELSDWVTLDKLVATQLNGQPQNQFFGYPDGNFMFSFDHDDHVQEMINVNNYYNFE